MPVSLSFPPREVMSLKDLNNFSRDKHNSLKAPQIKKKVIQKTIRRKPTIVLSRDFFHDRGIRRSSHVFLRLLHLLQLILLFSVRRQSPRIARWWLYAHGYSFVLCPPWHLSPLSSSLIHERGIRMWVRIRVSFGQRRRETEAGKGKRGRKEVCDLKLQFKPSTSVNFVVCTPQYFFYKRKYYHGTNRVEAKPKDWVRRKVNLS